MIPAKTPQLRAFLYVIRAADAGAPSPSDVECYRALFGWRPGNGKVFTSFADHPRVFVAYTQKDGTVVQTSAAGAYQATATTWDDFCRVEGKHDFSPTSQDDFAAWLIWKCGALSDIEAGRLADAMEKCAGRWASLPTATVPQPHRDYAFCQAAFQAAGGLLAKPPMKDEQPAAPVEDLSTEASIEDKQRIEPTLYPQPKGQPMPAILMALLPSILGLFAPRAQAALQKVTQQPADVVQPFVQSLFDKLGELTGKADPVQAVAAVTDPNADAAANAKVIEALQEHALDYLDKLGPTLDKLAGFDRDRWAAEQSGRESAAQVAKGEGWDMTRWLVWIAGFITAFMVVAILVTILRQVWIGNEPSVALIGLGGPLFMAAIQCWKEIFAYRFDGSKESSATNVAMTEMAKRQA